MILFYADGRLGNQLFQYALLRTLSGPDEKIVCANMGELFGTFDVPATHICHIENRYALKLFRKLVIPLIIRPLVFSRLFGVLWQNQDAEHRPLSSYSVRRGLLPITFVEPHFFQSESFFDALKVLPELKIRSCFQDEALNFLSDVPPGCTPVFVHVRRGDYTSIVYLQKHGIDLPAEYFWKAIQLAQRQLCNPHFVFVSDDPEFVEREFRQLSEKRVSRCSMGTDLAIMSQCEAGIISNSSFSWWGSALMARRNFVIAPMFWYGWHDRVDSHPGIQPNWAQVIDVAE